MYTLTIEYRNGEKLIYKYDSLSLANQRAAAWIMLNNPDIWKIAVDKEN